MPFKVFYTQKAKKQLTELYNNKALHKLYKAAQKCIKLLMVNPRHPGLNTHEYTKLTKEMGYKIFEAYAENKTPGAYRIFWRYRPEKSIITILSISPHP